ncbi:hypothetical protein [Burkholderia ubonensis]|uniref:hypothetical protein n=1 Tax=Burkholderia ubonensis TaxID=101571 RepID=UPI0012FAA4F8|nr:hypothetical protein [Burkholderia ubonensis]
MNAVVRMRVSARWCDEQVALSSMRPGDCRLWAFRIDAQYSNQQDSAAIGELPRVEVNYLFRRGDGCYCVENEWRKSNLREVFQ